MKATLEIFKKALQIQGFKPDKILKEEYIKLEVLAFQKFDLEQLYSLNDIFVLFESGEFTKSICDCMSESINSEERRILRFIDQCFKNAICKLTDQSKEKNHQESEDAEDVLEKIIPILPGDELQTTYEICKFIIRYISKRDDKADYSKNTENKKIINRISDDAWSVVSNYVDRDIKNEKFSVIDLEVLYIITRLFAFMVTIENYNIKENNICCHDEALNYLAFYLAKSFSSKDMSIIGEGLYYARRAIKIKKIEYQQKAFNYLGLCAIGKGERQLAYDTFYTWVNRCCTGDLANDLLPNFLDNNQKVFETVSNNDLEVAIHHNFACLCSEISESYELESKSKKSFHKMALKEIEKAIQVCDNNNIKTPPLFYSAYGDIILEEKGDLSKKLSKAYDQYIQYLNLAEETKNLDQQLGALSEIVSALTERFVLNYLNGQGIPDIFEQSEDFNIYFKKLKDTISEYKCHQDDSIKIDNKLDYIEKEQLEKWKYMYNLIESIPKQENSNALNELPRLLLMIDHIASVIKKELEWKEYSPNNYKIRDDSLEQDDDSEGVPKTIAYYTTLDTVKYVFQELCQDKEGVAPQEKDDKSDKEGKNCLTVMNAKYMNDPFEGLTLINVFADEINKQVNSNIDDTIRGHAGNTVLENVLWHNKPEIFRESIYDEYFVFLKSFTEAEDNLIMWNRYASDRQKGGDSDGCFVKLDAETFGNIVYLRKTIDSDILKKDNPEDNFSLYHVVYLLENEILDNKDNDTWKPSALLKKYYSALKRIVLELNEYLCRSDVRNSFKKEDWDGLVDHVSRYLQQSLRFIIFLFKDSDYAEEKESRMVYTCRSNNQEAIRVIKKTNPEKLCVNPFFQIYFTEIVFGPNVQDKNVWEPYFQYQLNNMWKKHLKMKNIQDKQSDINSIPDMQPNDMFKISSSKKHYRT